MSGNRPRWMHLVGLAIAVGAAAVAAYGCSSTDAPHARTVRALAATAPSGTSGISLDRPASAPISYSSPSTDATADPLGWLVVARTNASASRPPRQRVDHRRPATNPPTGTQPHPHERSRIPSAPTWSTSGPHDDEFRDLTIAPVPASSPRCEGVYYAGERLLIGASGFLPLTPVRVFVESRGAAGLEQQLASLIADHTGAISATVQIPPRDTGLTPRGQSVDVIFLDAIGLGADGVSHAAAIQMAGLAPPGSPCASASH